MPDNVLEQILTHKKESPFYSIQLDEYTGITDVPQLSVFIRYMNNAAQKICYFTSIKVAHKG